MALEGTDIFPRLERFYDAVPRDAAVAEDIGEFVLFVRQGAGWPYYARPKLGGQTPSAADVTAVRARQREAEAPEEFEWVHETTPDLLAVARSAGLDVLLAPLLVLDRAALVPDLPVPGATIRFLDPAADRFAADVAASRAVGRLGFGAPATTPATSTAGTLILEPAGPAQRDAVPTPGEQLVADQRRRHASGRMISAVVESAAEGIVACGSVQRVDGVAEVVGVATLPSARRRGYASQLTANLARRSLQEGDDLVFLSAGDDDVARLYSKVGFRRLGTACIGSPASSAALG
ncbi:GNAT family N-acetyltransferase [Actinoplanes sp. TFC3]|uniref:GNAT family N-acetyltransferase n=1 Tax=Actinoplanes sp. TFC3 TaxID=1710355 RepID=UPI00082A7203|nr:GNAT family N-acetyltransferase [Actinoplanes sp. TFC3]